MKTSMKVKGKWNGFLFIMILTFMLGTACSKTSEKDGTQNEASDAEAVTSIYESLSDEISDENMLSFIETVASVDDARITGFDGESNTASLIQTHFDNLNLETETQSFPIQAYKLNNHSLTITSMGDTALTMVNPLSFSVGTAPEGITAQVVSVGLGADEDYTGKDVQGKIALIQRGGEFFYVKTNRAFEYGAVGVIFYDPNGESISATLTKLSNIPAVSILKSDADKMESSLANGEKVEVNLIIDAMVKDSTSQNVIGIYKSSNNPDGKKVIIGAHYDGVNTPAANDNASGTALILEIARIIAEQKVELPFDLEFIAFGAEEIGLIGSDYYAYEMTQDEKRNTLFMLNYDMVGVGDGVDIATVGDSRSTKLTDKAQEVFTEIGYTASTSVTDRSDHASFAAVGIKSIYIQATPDHNYHTDEDTLDKIKPDMLKAICDFSLKLIVEGLPEMME